MNPPGTFSDYEEWTQRDITAASSADGTIFNGSFGDLPVEPDRRRWLDLGRPDEVEIHFVPWQPFPPCEMLLRIPIVLPNTLPTVNTWHMSFIFEGSSEANPAASFVIPGFHFGAKSSTERALHAQHIFQASGLDYFAFSKRVASKGCRLMPQRSTFTWLLLVCLSLVVL